MDILHHLIDTITDEINKNKDRQNIIDKLNDRPYELRVIEQEFRRDRGKVLKHYNLFETPLDNSDVPYNELNKNQKINKIILWCNENGITDDIKHDYIINYRKLKPEYQNGKITKLL